MLAPSQSGWTQKPEPPSYFRLARVAFYQIQIVIAKGEAAFAPHNAFTFGDEFNAAQHALKHRRASVFSGYIFIGSRHVYNENGHFGEITTRPQGGECPPLCPVDQGLYGPPQTQSHGRTNCPRTAVTAASSTPSMRGTCATRPRFLSSTTASTRTGRPAAFSASL